MTVPVHIKHAVFVFILKTCSFFCLFMCVNLQVTAVSFNDTSDQVLSGGIDNEIKVQLTHNLTFRETSPTT